MPRNHKSKKPLKSIKPMKLDISDEMIAERRGGSGKMPRNMPKWMALAITKIDLFNKWVGNTVCWITIPLIFAMVYEVLRFLALPNILFSRTKCISLYVDWLSSRVYHER